MLKVPRVRGVGEGGQEAGGNCKVANLARYSMGGVLSPKKDGTHSPVGPVNVLTGISKEQERISRKPQKIWVVSKLSRNCQPLTPWEEGGGVPKRRKGHQPRDEMGPAEIGTKLGKWGKSWEGHRHRAKTGNSP